MASKIVFNGQEYSSVEAMPPDVRQAWRQVMGMFADRNGDGVPDLFQGEGVEPTVIQQSSFVVNGKTYPSLDAMPPDVRRMYEQAMGAVEAMGPGAGTPPRETPLSFAITAGQTTTPEPPAQRTRGGSASPRWGEDAPSRFSLPWMLVLVLLAVLVWVLLRQA